MPEVVDVSFPRKCSDRIIFHRVRKYCQKFVFGWLLACFSPVLLAEYGAVADLPKIQLDKPGSINAIVELPDGSVIVGGDFSRINGREQDCIARLKPDGTVDDGWNPQIRGSGDCVKAMLLAGNKLYVGGIFRQVGGKARKGICRLDVATGQVDLGWYPVAEGDITHKSVYSLILTPTGNELFIGGNFEKLGKDIVAVAKVSTVTGDVDPNWNPGMATGSQVRAMALSGNSLYIGGNFSTVSGIGRNNIAKLDADGTGALDTTWNPDADSIVSTLIVSEAGDKLYAGGDFRNVGGFSRKGIARMDSTGNGSVDSWDAAPVGIPGFIASVKALDLAGNHLYAGGQFAEIGGQVRSNIARLSTMDASADSAWNPNINKKVLSLLLSADGSRLHVGGRFFKTGQEDSLSFSTVDSSGGNLIAGFNDLNIADSGSIQALEKNGDNLYFAGDFVRVNGQPRFFLGKINSTTGQAQDWGADFNSSVWALALSSDGSALYVGGDFTDIGGTQRNHLAKLSAANASVISGWDRDTNGSVRALLLNGNDLYVGGRFYIIQGGTQHYLAKLFADTGALNTAWNADPNQHVMTLELSGSDLFVGGIFTSMGGLSRNRLAKVNAGTGAVDPAWVADANSTVRVLLAKDNALYVGGHFTEIGGLTRNRIARLNASNATIDANWNPDANGDVFSLALSGDGNDLYLGGWFGSIKGTERYKIAKISTSGAELDAEWDLSMSTSGGVYAMLLESSGVYAGGEFEHIGGKSTALGNIVDGHLLTVTVTADSYQAQKGAISSEPEGIKCSPYTGYRGCEQALVPGGYTLTAASADLQMSISQEWISGCDSAGGGAATCGVALNSNRTVEVALTCELYDFLPPEEPVISSMTTTCNSIKATKGYEIGKGGQVRFRASSQVELGPGFRVSDAPGFFSVTMQ